MVLQVQVQVCGSQTCEHTTPVAAVSQVCDWLVAVAVDVRTPLTDPTPAGCLMSPHLITCRPCWNHSHQEAPPHPRCSCHLTLVCGSFLIPPSPIYVHQNARDALLSKPKPMMPRIGKNTVVVKQIRFMNGMTFWENRGKQKGNTMWR